MSDSKIKQIRRVTLAGLWINVVLVVLKLAVGYSGHSDALVADGYHSFSDFVTDFIVLAFVAASCKKADSDHPYGHGKYETVATVLIGLILLVVSVLIGVGGAEKFIAALRGEVLPRPDMLTLCVAAVSILLKEGCYRYTIAAGRSLDSSSLIANAWHHRSDAISSVATLIGVGMALFCGEQWRIMDPAVSVLIAFMIGISAIKIAMPSVNELLEVSLPQETVGKMYDAIRAVSGVCDVHNLRARRNGHSTIVDVNIHVDPDISVRRGHAIASAVEQTLADSFGLDIIVYVHTEPQE